MRHKVANAARRRVTQVCVSLALLVPLCLAAEAQGTFSLTADLINGRRDQTATLLKDGRVLIAGGFVPSGPGFVATAEIYDPATETFSPTGAPIHPRAQHTATLLADGRVLLAGGYTCSARNCTQDGTAEIYDPITGTFQDTGKTTPQGNPSSVLLANGKVLMAGGILSYGPSADSDAFAALYDPATGEFQELDWKAGFWATLTLLPDGKVLIAGGADGAHCQIYDPQTGSLSPALSLAAYPNGVYWQTTALLPNGKVLIAGGTDDGDGVNPLNTAVRVDLPRTGAALHAVTASPLKQPRQLHSATSLPGGQVLIAGGGNPPSLTSAELYDPTTGQFNYAGDMSTVRSSHTATLLTDGRVLMVGGYGPRAPNTAELYRPVVRAISTASLTGPLAPESLATLTGSVLAPSTETADPHSPRTYLGDISLRVTDSAGQARMAPLMYVSPAEIRFQVPAGTATGDANIEVIGAPSVIAPVKTTIAATAPGLFAQADGQAQAYALRVEADGTQTVLPPGPITLDDRAVYLCVSATGVRNRSTLGGVQATVDGKPIPVTYAGPTGTAPGWDQVNLLLSSDLKGGSGNLIVTVDGFASNAVLIDVR